MTREVGADAARLVAALNATGSGSGKRKVEEVAAEPSSTVPSLPQAASEGADSAESVAALNAPGSTAAAESSAPAAPAAPAAPVVGEPRQSPKKERKKETKTRAPATSPEEMQRLKDALAAKGLGTTGSAQKLQARLSRSL